jgi:EmrB/QacA subfamily drug resistance transporter
VRPVAAKSRREAPPAEQLHKPPRSASKALPPGALLAVICLAQFMVLLDVSIVNVALPSIQHDLAFTTDSLQWVVNIYTIAFGGLLMLGGRAADLFGQRRVFIAGTTLFALASLGCALAASQGQLLAARAAQGIGSAFVSPATLSIVTSSFAEGAERNHAVAVWGAMGALGGSLGALLGGLLTQTVGWPAIFAVNVPLGAVIVLSALRFVAPHRPTEGPGNLDVAGAALVTLAVGALTYAVVRTDRLGWGSAGVLAPLIAGVALLAAFLIVEGRVAKAPLVPLHVFRIERVSAANLLVAVIYSAFFPMFFFLTLYLQRVLHYSPIVTGLLFLPLGLAVFVMSVLAPRLVARFPRAVITAGMLTAATGLALMTGIAPGRGQVWFGLVGGFLMMGGLGLSLVPSTIVATQGLPPGMSGLGSALMNTSRLLGGALGLAILVTVAAAHTRGEFSVSGAQALTDGFSRSLGISAAVCVVGAVTALVLLRGGAGTAPNDPRARTPRRRAAQ